MRKSERLQNLPKVMWLLMAKQGEILRIFTFHGADGHELDSGEWNHGPGWIKSTACTLDLGPNCPRNCCAIMWNEEPVPILKLLMLLRSVLLSPVFLPYSPMCMHSMRNMYLGVCKGSPTKQPSGLIMHVAGSAPFPNHSSGPLFLWNLSSPAQGTSLSRGCPLTRTALTARFSKVWQA